MPIFQTKHNANLLNTVPESRPIVNCVSSIVGKPVIDYIERYEGDSAWYKVDYAPSKLFVKVTNSIYDYQLHPRLLEFYCLMSYLCYSLPDTELPILRIQELINQFTGININKNSINTYLNNLIEFKLIKRVGKFYHIHEPTKVGLKVIPLAKRVDASKADGSWSNGLYSRSCDDSNLIDNRLENYLDTSDLTNSRQAKACHPLSKRDNNKNHYYNPKGNWTPFYITIYNTNTKFGSMAVEMYLASKAYNYHHPDIVCNDLNISRKTYYTYLSDLISKKIVKRHKLTYKCYHYTNDYRIVLWNDYESIMESRYELNDMNWKEIKLKRKQRQKDTNKQTAKSRIWYQSSMGRIMKEYNINYHPGFDNFNPEDAYLIVQELEQQYRSNPSAFKAGLIVKAILEAWNWTKIQDRIHAKRKRAELKDNARRFDTRYMMDYV
jgi:hypothetical protein